MSADVRTDFYPYILCIRGDDIKIAKRLKPCSEDDVQVLFRFGVSEKTSVDRRHFVGLGDVWDGAVVLSGSDEPLPSCVELPDQHKQKLYPSDFFHEWRKFQQLGFNFKDLAETFLGYEGKGSMEALICDKLLYGFCGSFKPKAELKVVGNPGQPPTVEIIVRFFYKNVAPYIYIFTLERKQAEKLFELP